MSSPVTQHSPSMLSVLLWNDRFVKFLTDTTYSFIEAQPFDGLPGKLQYVASTHVHNLLAQVKEFGAFKSEFAASMIARAALETALLYRSDEFRGLELSDEDLVKYLIKQVILALLLPHTVLLNYINRVKLGRPIDKADWLKASKADLVKVDRLSEADAEKDIKAQEELLNILENNTNFKDQMIDFLNKEVELFIAVGKQCGTITVGC